MPISSTVDDLICEIEGAATTRGDDQLDDIRVQQNADRLLALHEIHYDYAQQLDARRRREIADLKMLVRDLLNVVETGHMNHLAMAKARKIGRAIT